jgi:hypothetical protein
MKAKSLALIDMLNYLDSNIYIGFIFFLCALLQSGVLVKRINPVTDAANILMIGDVVLKIDGIDVANDGTVPYRVDERISASFLVSQKYCGDFCKLDVLRNNKQARHYFSCQICAEFCICTCMMTLK